MRYREWEAFKTDTPCPYQFEKGELERHAGEVEEFNDSQEFWEGLEGVLPEVGFALNETYGRAVEAVRGLREVGLEGLEGEEREGFEKETQWVTDLG